MKKLFLTLFAVMATAIGALAQESFETAVAITAGQNEATAYKISSWDTGAYFKYTATEQCVISITPIDDESIYFYDEDKSENYGYASEYDATNVTTYSLKLEAGQSCYLMASQSYSATGDNVSFNATITTGVFQHGMSQEDPLPLEMGKKTWFVAPDAYMTYTATDEGVLVITQLSYNYGASYTVDGVTTQLSWDSSTKELKIPVLAGKTYSIWTSASSYSSMFAITAKFTQPKQGDIAEDPFELLIGSNPMPAAAQQYFYSFINDDDAGFLTILADGCTLSARTASGSNIASNLAGTMRIFVDMDQEVIVIVERPTEAPATTNFTALFSLPEEGDLESKPIILASSQTDKAWAPVGEKFFSIKNNEESVMLLHIVVDTKGISSYGSTQFKVYEKGDNYKWGQALSTDEEYTTSLEPGQEYMVYVNNVGNSDIEFRAWLSTIEAGATYSKPILAELGQNTVSVAGQTFYKYTATKDCKLSVKVGNSETTTLFFPSYDGDEYYGLTLLSNQNGEYVLAAEAGDEVIFRMTGAAIGDKFTVKEISYGPGETQSTAYPIDSDYALDDLAPYNVWTVYTAQKSGLATITPFGFDGMDISWTESVEYAVNDGYINSMLGYDAAWNQVPMAKTFVVSEGDKIYVHLKITSECEGAGFSIEVNPVTLNEAGFATFSSAQDLNITTPGVVAYKASVEGETITLTALEGYIPSGAGVLLYGEGLAGAEVAFAEETDWSATCADLSGNALKATTINFSGKLAEMEDNAWVLGTGNQFLKYTGNAFVGNRAYLVHEVSSVKNMKIVFADEADALTDVIAVTAKNGKFLENGRLVILKDGKKFNAAGQQVK